MSMIKVENLTFSYPSSYDPIFENVSFQIDTDWKLGFVGRNGRGKTTFLNALSQAIPPEERIVTIEDSAELQLKYAQNLVSLETRNANNGGMQNDFRAGSDPQQFKNAAGSDYRRGSSRCRDL